MTVTIARAKSVCTAKEYALVRMSLPNHAAKLTPARLREKIALTRTQRDKWRDLAKSQRRKGQVKKKTRGAAPDTDNTVLKATIFDETLARYQAALEKAQSESGADTKKKASKKTSKKTSKKKAAKRPNRTTAKRDAILESKQRGAPKPVKKSGKRKSVKKSAPDTAGETAPEKKAKKTSASKKKSASRKKAAKSMAAALKAKRKLPRAKARKGFAEETKGQRIKSNYRAAGTMRVQGHVGSQTRRHQAKRDSR